MSEHRWVIRTLSAPQRRLMPPTDIDDITYEFETRDFDPDETYVISRADCLHGPIGAVGLCFGDFDLVQTVDLGHVLQTLEDDLLYNALVSGAEEDDLRLTEAVIDLEDEVVDYFVETCRRDALAEGIDDTAVIRLSYKREATMAWLAQNRPDLHDRIEQDVAHVVDDIMSGSRLDQSEPVM